MPDSTESIISLKSVDKVYPGAIDTQVLFAIDLEFKKGTFNSIVGQSGSGKSTLLNIIGILDRPTRGEVYIDNQRTDELGKDRLAQIRNRTIGFVFQFHYLLPEFTVIENVLIPYQIAHGRISAQARDRANELLKLVSISQVKDNLATRISGGQQQRAAIARALMNNPAIILADEPTGNLDSVTTETIYDTFRRINQEYGTTFVIVTHNMQIAQETDRIVEIKDGRVEMDVRK